MSEPNASNVAVGKPHGKNGRVAGGAWFCPLDKVKTLPTDATTPLGDEWVSAGWLSDDGIKNKRDRKTEDITAFGGATVLTVTKSLTETWSFGMLETTVDTLTVAYGAANVTVDGDKVTVRHNADEVEKMAWVFELALTGGRIKRTVVPVAALTDMDDVTAKDGEAIVLGPTLTGFPSDDFDGDFAREFIAKVADASSPAEKK